MIAAMLGVGALAGCVPADPSPTPTPTVFASEEEAFAAAEATYRAYVDALNQVDLSDPSTFEEVYRWTTGDANAGARQLFSEMNAEGLSVSGSSMIELLSPIDFDAGSSTVELTVCLDVREVSVTDETGASIVDPDRTDVQSLSVVVAQAPTETGLAVAEVQGREGEPLCE